MSRLVPFGLCAVLFCVLSDHPTVADPDAPPRRTGLKFEVREYEVDPEDLSAETVAAKVGLPAEQVFKTLVVRGDRTGLCFAVVPGNMELDPKALAKLTGDRRFEPGRAG